MRLTKMLGEFSDDDLRIAADGVASLHNLNNEFNGWARMISGASRQELLLILAWCAKWMDLSMGEMETIKSMPAMLRSKLRSGEWPGLSGTQIDRLANLIEDAICVTVPEEER